MARIVFTLTIFVSAFMLFLVQPLIGKLILPKLGGTPQVWNTCMLFFQSALLLGYAYTNAVSTRLKLRQQLMLHSAVLGIPILVMILFPIYHRVQIWTPPSGSNPIFDTLILLATIVGIPFLVVATSAPLLQRWFTYSGDPSSKDPYFLYSASNAGSLLSLLLYPVLIEPNTFLETQSYIWYAGYGILAMLILYCAFTIFKTAPSDEQIAADAIRADSAANVKTETAAPAPAPVTAAEASTAVKSGAAPAMPTRGIQRKKGAKIPGALDDGATPSITAPTPHIATGANAEMSAWRRIRWVLLAAVPSSLMLGVTSYISTDLSPFPLIWILPLALYLVSFIVVYLKGWTSYRVPIFSPQGYTMHEITLYVLQPIGLIILCFIGVSRSFDPVFGTLMTLAGFFFSALACHGELAEDRPDTKHLTEYYLLMSVGGALGGTFNGMIAPLVFQGGVREFYIAIVVACFVRPQYITTGWFDDLVLQAFPGLQGWVRNQGDEMAKSMGRPEPRSTYLFSVFLDILLGLFILSISALLKQKLSNRESAFYAPNMMKFLGIPDDWFQFVFNVGTFGIPIIFCFFFAGRPLRFGLAVAALFIGSLYLGVPDDDRTLEARRTYFGILRVLQEPEYSRDIDEAKFFSLNHKTTQDGKFIPPQYSYTYLMHGTTYHGRNYIYNPLEDKTQRDISRLATTYYHRYGPVGIVMEQDNWFKGKQGTFAADARLPAAIVGQIAACFGSLPVPAIVEPWSEPPFATIGLGSGTMAGYARPYQHMTYYEIDDVIRHFSMPEDSSLEGRFTFLQQAARRGVNLEVVMGDARQSLEKSREKDNFGNTFTYTADFRKEFLAKKGDRHYSTSPYVNINIGEGAKDWPNREKTYSAIREKYYKVIVVDAFSSDAIPVHLVTRQAVQLYLDKMTDNGVLCVHTSNRHLDLVRPVARIAKELDIESRKKGEKVAADKTFKDDKERDAFLKNYEINCLVGKDGAEREGFMGHFSSEYVMIFKGDSFDSYVKDLAVQKEGIDKKSPPEGKQILNSQVRWFDPYKDEFVVGRSGQRFKVHSKVTMDDSLWTDDYSHIVGVIRWPQNSHYVVVILGIAIALVVALLGAISTDGKVWAWQWGLFSGIWYGPIPVALIGIVLAATAYFANYVYTFVHRG